MEFWKYSALGNTFLIVPVERVPRGRALAWVQRACNAHDGVAADGVVFVHVPTARLSIYNADGTRAPLSGNGARSAAAWWFAHQDPRTEQIVWRTDAGEIPCRKHGTRSVEVQLPPPDFDARAIPARTRESEVWAYDVRLRNVHSGRVRLYALSVGNPQCVVWGRGIPRGWRDLGRAIGRLPLFPAGTNVAFTRPTEGGLETRLWERGVGETQASGTGAAAAAVVAMRLGRCPRRVRVHMPGGTMTVHWRADSTLRLRGSVTPVAAGVVHTSGGPR